MYLIFAETTGPLMLTQFRRQLLLVTEKGLVTANWNICKSQQIKCSWIKQEYFESVTALQVPVYIHLQKKAWGIKLSGYSLVDQILNQ